MLQTVIFSNWFYKRNSASHLNMTITF